MMLDGGDAGDEFDGPAASAGAKGGNAALKQASARAAAAHKEPPPKKTEPCPKCDKPVKVTAHRCPACGYKLRDVVSNETREAEAKFQNTIRLGIAGLVLLGVIVIAIIGLTGRSSRPGK